MGKGKAQPHTASGVKKPGLSIICPECGCAVQNHKLLVTHMTARHPSAKIPPE